MASDESRTRYSILSKIASKKEFCKDKVWPENDWKRKAVAFRDQGVLFDEEVSNANLCGVSPERFSFPWGLLLNSNERWRKSSLKDFRETISQNEGTSVDKEDAQGSSSEVKNEKKKFSVRFLPTVKVFEGYHQTSVTSFDFDERPNFSRQFGLNPSFSLKDIGEHLPASGAGRLYPPAASEFAKGGKKSRDSSQPVALDRKAANNLSTWSRVSGETSFDRTESQQNAITSAGNTSRSSTAKAADELRQSMSKTFKPRNSVLTQDKESKSIAQKGRSTTAGAQVREFPVHQRESSVDPKMMLNKINSGVSQGRSHSSVLKTNAWRSDLSRPRFFFRKAGASIEKRTFTRHSSQEPTQKSDRFAADHLLQGSSANLDEHRNPSEESGNHEPTPETAFILACNSLTDKKPQPKPYMNNTQDKIVAMERGVKTKSFVEYFRRRKNSKLLSKLSSHMKTLNS